MGPKPRSSLPFPLSSVNIAAGSSHNGVIDDSNAVALDSESGSVTPSELSSDPISQEEEEGPEVISGGDGSSAGSNQSAGSEVTALAQHHDIVGVLQGLKR